MDLVTSRLIGGPCVRIQGDHNRHSCLLYDASTDTVSMVLSNQVHPIAHQKRLTEAHRSRFKKALATFCSKYSTKASAGTVSTLRRSPRLFSSSSSPTSSPSSSSLVSSSLSSSSHDYCDLTSDEVDGKIEKSGVKRKEQEKEGKKKTENKRKKKHRYRKRKLRRQNRRNQLKRKRQRRKPNRRQRKEGGKRKTNRKKKTDSEAE